MKPSYSSVLHVIFILFVGASLPLTKGSFDAAQRLEEVIEQAERESKILADEINQWLIHESASLVSGDEQVHFRSRRSVDEDDEEEGTKPNLLLDVNRLIVRRDVGKYKESHKKTKSSSKVKRKDENAGLLKKHESDIQVDKHVKKVTAKKVTEEKAKDKRVAKVLKSKRVSKQKDKKPKHKKQNNDELSKANLVKALIGGDSGAKNYKEQTGVPENAYRELVEFMAGAEQATIETTGSKKSDIAKPERTNHKGGQSRKGNQLVRRTLTKKHKRVLSILSKMPRNVLRKYFHLKGLDKYWKVMENIRRKHTAKQSGNKKLEAHKDAKDVKKVKDFAPKRVKTSSELKHHDKIRLLQKQEKLQQKDSKQAVSQHKTVKDKAGKKTVKDETTKTNNKEKGVKETLKDKTTEKSQKSQALQSPLSPKLVGIAKQTHPKKLQLIQNETAHLEKKQNHKLTVEQYAKGGVKPQKDLPKNPPKETKSKDVVKVEEKIQKNDAGKSVQKSKAELHVKNSTSSNKIPEKPKSPEVKDVSKQNAEKKVSLKPVVAKQTALPKDSKDRALHAKDQHAQVGKVMKVNAIQMKSPASSQFTKLAVKLQAVKNKDQIRMAGKQKPQENGESLQEQLKAMSPKVQHMVTKQNSSTVTHEKPKGVPKVPAVTEYHDVKTEHAPQKPADKHEKSSQVKQQNSAPNNIDILKEKIQRTNNLKFKVAQALLAHCETQNRLRQVFDEVNSSLKKAASLAKAIGAKFGITPRDIEKMTSEHTEGAVEQFLNKLF